MPKTYDDDVLKFYVHLTNRNSCPMEKEMGKNGMGAHAVDNKPSDKVNNVLIWTVVASKKKRRAIHCNILSH